MSFFTGSGRYKPLQSLKSVLPDVESDEETVFLRGAFTSHRSSTLYSDLTPDPSDIHGNTESGWNFNDEKLHMNAQINELHINTGNDDKSDMESSEYQTIGFGFEASNWGDRTSSGLYFYILTIYNII